MSWSSQTFGSGPEIRMGSGRQPGTFGAGNLLGDGPATDGRVRTRVPGPRRDGGTARAGGAPGRPATGGQPTGRGPSAPVAHAAGGSILGGVARRARRPETGGPAGGDGDLGTAVRSALPWVAGTLGAGLVVLGGLAWAGPATEVTTRPVGLQQRLVIGYEGSGKTNAAYPTGRVSTPEPVFTKLVRTIDVRLGYQVAAGGGAAAPTGLTGLEGTRRVTAEVRSANGWHRGFELLPRARFAGDRFDAVAELELARLKALVRGVEKATGSHPDGYTVAVRSEIAVTGQLAGRVDGRLRLTPFRQTFFPELVFDYDGTQLALAETAAPGSRTVTRATTAGIGIPGDTPARVPADILPGPATLAGPPAAPTRIWAPLAGLALLGAAYTARRRTLTAPDRVVRRITLD